jgi:hypothetical protein
MSDFAGVREEYMQGVFESKVLRMFGLRGRNNRRLDKIVECGDFIVFLNHNNY